MFVKRIGIVWFQGENNIDKPHFIENINNWKSLNPDWEIVILDDKKLRQICKNYSEECLKVYDSFDIMHLKIDFARYVVLWETCSMYVDMDCYAFRSLSKSKEFNEFLNKIKTYDHIVGLSETSTNSIEKIFVNMSINNGILISSLRNPVIKDLIDSIIKNNLDYKNKRKRISSDYILINTVTGPTMINNFFSRLDLKKYKEKIYIHKFPYYIFEPGQPFQSFDVRHDTIALHKYELSWLSPHMKVAAKHYYHSIKPYFLISIIFLLILWLIYKYYYKDCEKRCKTMCSSLKND